MINKKDLLSTKAFIDNTYLIEYLRLINANKETKRERFKTQKHHIIPRSYYKINNLPINNSEINLVNLSLKDHLLAHYYLSLCVTDQYKYALVYAFNYMYNKLNKNNIQIDIKDIDFTEYEKLYKIFCENQSRKKKGHIPWNKGGGCYTEAQLLNMRNAHLGKKDSEETKKKKSLSSIGTNKGGCYVNNGSISKHIQLSELDEYLLNGWVKGSIQDHSKHIGMKILHKDDKEIRVFPQQISKYIALGWKFGRSKKARENNSKAKKGKPSWNKGIPWSDEARKNLSLHHGNFKNKIFMTNDFHTIRIDVSQQEEYEKQGYHRGMK